MLQNQVRDNGNNQQESRGRKEPKQNTQFSLIEHRSDVFPSVETLRFHDTWLLHIPPLPLPLPLSHEPPPYIALPNALRLMSPQPPLLYHLPPPRHDYSRFGLDLDSTMS